MSTKRYTDKQKLAYFKKKAASSGRKKAAPYRSSKKKAPARRKSNTVGQALGGALGTFLGGAPGGALGAALGGGAQELVRSITGFGDYKVSHNSLMGDQDTVPMFKSSSRSTMVYHREYIQDILSSPVAGAFNMTSFSINPALASTFPWLCEIAEQFEEYRIHGMIFEYKTTSSDALNSTNTALGTVVLATQYNSLAVPFLNKQQMENYEFACSTKPSCSVIHPIECAYFENPTNILYTRTGVVSTGDLRLYDIGRFNIATVGMQAANVVLGELWVSYAVEFLKPRLTDSADVADHFSVPLPATMDASHYFGTNGGLGVATIVPQPGSNFGVTLTDTTVTIPKWFSGNIIFSYQVLTSPSTNAQIGPDAVGTNGATELPFWNRGLSLGYGVSASPGLVGARVMVVTSVFRCVNGGTITLSGVNTGLAGADTVDAVDLFVASFSGDLNS